MGVHGLFTDISGNKHVVGDPDRVWITENTPELCKPKFVVEFKTPWVFPFEDLLTHWDQHKNNDGDKVVRAIAQLYGARSRMGCVVEETFEGEAVVMKVVDETKCIDLTEELRHEAEQYKLMSDLDCIPRLKGARHGAIRALENMHAKGLVHGDVKLANIMLDTGTGQVKLIDFGFTKPGGRVEQKRELECLNELLLEAEERAAKQVVGG
uniref:Protein kinase domain-containing protein n=1 Tax=Hyaloperonospora arabidopsidis (strain Emoy2) TaxID=559515 RepID=M4BRP7_HYAAE